MFIFRGWDQCNGLKKSATLMQSPHVSFLVPSSIMRMMHKFLSALLTLPFVLLVWEINNVFGFPKEKNAPLEFAKAAVHPLNYHPRFN